MVSRAEPARRRKRPAERRDEMVRAAAAVALSDGLEKVTAKSVATALGVFPGLVSHYFATADDLVAAAFSYSAQSERDELFAATADAPPTERIARLIAAWLDSERDAVSLLWLDAWQASRRRPPLAEAVAAQMDDDLRSLSAVVRAGVEAGTFTVADGDAAALQIFSLVDGLSVQAATRDRIDYRPVHTMVVATAERILGLEVGTLKV